MFKNLHPKTRIVWLLLFGIICIIFPIYILDHEFMRSTIKKIQNANDTNLQTPVIYAALWYVPLIIGSCILTFIPIRILVVHLKNKKKERAKADKFYTGY